MTAHWLNQVRTSFATNASQLFGLRPNQTTQTTTYAKDQKDVLILSVILVTNSKKRSPWGANSRSNIRRTSPSFMAPECSLSMEYRPIEMKISTLDARRNCGQIKCTYRNQEPTTAWSCTVPSDYQLFRGLLNFLDSKKFADTEDPRNAVVTFITSKPTEIFKRGIEKLIRWHIVVNSSGEYIID
jgi:hypothetical protein